MNVKITDIDGRKPSFVQWDVDRVLYISGCDSQPCLHFANIVLKRAIVVEAEADGSRWVCRVPNFILQYAEPMLVSVFVQPDEGKTVLMTWFAVTPKMRPQDYTYEENIGYVNWVAKSAEAEELLENIDALRAEIAEAAATAGSARDQAVAAAEDIDETVSAALAAAKASGEFDGKDGKDGADGTPGAKGDRGDDGVSPTINVTEITGGHRVNMSDARGDYEFDVMDGATGPAGQPGATGPKGDQGEKGDPFEYEDFTPAQLEALTGPQGPKGDKGEQGVADAIWRSEVIGLMYPSDYEMEISDLVGRSGAEPKAGDLVIGPEPGGMANPTPTHLYTIRTRYNTWVLLDDVGSIKGDTGATGPQGPQGPAGDSGVTVYAFFAESSDLEDPFAGTITIKDGPIPAEVFAEVSHHDDQTCYALVEFPWFGLKLRLPIVSAKSGGGNTVKFGAYVSSSQYLTLENDGDEDWVCTAVTLGAWTGGAY